MITINNTAIVENTTKIGDGTIIWHYTHIDHNASIGKNVVIGQGCYIGKNVVIGDNCRIQNNVNIFTGVKIGNNVFIGPNVTFTNVKKPDALKKQKFEQTIIKDGVTIGAGAVILCGITLEKKTFVGAGSVVTKSTLPNSTIIGNPAKIMRRKKKNGNK